MIEIVNAHNLKNITQIGTPGTEEEKIYIENAVYTRIHIEEFRDKRVFVFMGHTESENGRYRTFLENVIPVCDIEFRDGIPVWNNRTWSEVFREIKRNYADSIIVGWAFDQRGVKPSATSELEAIHREHFGGIHQLLFLMDSTAGDESFYVLRSNRLYPKAGFYIYYSTVKTSVPDPLKLEVEWVKKKYSDSQKIGSQSQKVKSEGYTVTRISEKQEENNGNIYRAGGHYRQLLRENQTASPVKKRNPMAAVVVFALLLGIAGVAISKNQDAVKDIQTWVSGVYQGKDDEQGRENWQIENADSQNIIEQTVPEQSHNSQTEQEITEQQSQHMQEDIPEIPVEKVDGGID